MTFQKAIQQFTEAPLSRQIMMAVLKRYRRPNDKISELVKRGELITVKNGLYVAGPKSNINSPEPFLLANHLFGPSYVSLESALSFWGFIPERVSEVISVTSKLSKTYRTPVGRFRYLRCALPYYSFGIKRVSLTPKQVVLIASPEKAICDKIIKTSGVALRSTKQVKDFLVGDQRIAEELLIELDVEAISSWISDSPKKESLEMLVKTIIKIR